MFARFLFVVVSNFPPSHIAPFIHAHTRTNTHTLIHTQTLCFSCSCTVRWPPPQLLSKLISCSQMISNHSSLGGLPENYQWKGMCNGGAYSLSAYHRSRHKLVKSKIFWCNYRSRVELPFYPKTLSSVLVTPFWCNGRPKCYM